MIGQQFGHYEVESRLGSGGMGVVYLALDMRLKRRVAIKVLADGRVADELARARFRREAQALSRLNHPNIATIYDFDQRDGCDFLVMEYIEGRSLRDLGPDPLPPADVVRLGTQLAEALVAAHGAGVVHLDLKPGNMMLTADGRLKVLDFGLARLHAPDIDDASTETGAPATGGTAGPGAGSPPYMAPEQVAGGPLDPRTDIYSAGATLYELATGRRVFDKPRGDGLYESILRDTPNPPSQHNAGITGPLEAALMKALEKQPSRRQQTAKELLRDLQDATETATRPAAATPGRTRRGIAVITAAAVVAVAVSAYALWPRSGRAAFHAREFVLIGDLENRTNDPLLPRTVQEALSIALQQSQFVNLVPRERVADALGRMNRPAGAVLNEATARDLCQREGVPVFVAGSVTTSGKRTQIAVRVLEAGTGALIFAGTAEYEKPDELFARVDDLAVRLRQDLGESIDAIEQNSRPLQKVTTGSIDALRQYSSAVEARAMGDSDKVEAPLLAALQLDRDFAMAHLKLADYYFNIAGSESKGLPEMDEAYRLRDRVSEREKHFIAAQYFEAHDQFEKSLANLKILSALYPDDAEARYDLALAHYALEDLKNAIFQLREAIKLNPNGARAPGSLALILARDNQPQAAIDVTSAALANRIDSPYLYWGRGLALLGLGRTADARADFERLARIPGYYAHLGLLLQARASLYAGDNRDAASRLTRLVALANRAGDYATEIVTRVQMGRLAALLGDRAAVEAQSAALAVLTAGDYSSPAPLHDAGSVALLAGDVRLAQRHLARLAALEVANATPLVRASRLLLAGEIALHQGRPADAARLQNDALALRPWYMYAAARAEAFEKMGDWPRASEAWADVLNARGQVLQDGFPPDLTVARERRARAADRQLAAHRKDD